MTLSTVENLRKETNLNCRALEDKGGKEWLSRNSEKSLLAMSSLLCLNLNCFRIQNKSQGLDKGNENVVDIRSATNYLATDKVDSKESTEH